MRLNKYLSEAGYCSRREADRLIETGNVYVDGEKAVLGTQVTDSQEVRVGKKVITKQDPEVLLAVHKPRGIECTASKEVKNNIVDFVHYPIRIYPIGRLDKDSEGLILMTNQGELVNKILRSRYEHEKEYEVTIDVPVTDTFLERMAGGIYLEELQVTTRKCRVNAIGEKTFSIVLTQGFNRQIRRMCASCQVRVVKLKRIRIMNIHLGTLKKGSWRNVTEKEKRELERNL